MAQTPIVSVRAVKGRKYGWEKEVILTLSRKAKVERVISDTLESLEISLNLEEAERLKQQLDEVLKQL
ncbi:hypothetical protein A2V49_01600 [candidate division WWE3 bacterium RBG_19FT_COMBO_34_6]|uniref:Uncharacterized protein n=1 Tax=candidate division WWE3 bacterium RBG_19FT_COMBO_34_6 TaxID=1802612 RepID=A0A1F4UJY2_UNCKA|nr:MAG: hypothetical protein A2V49_01600 [candidate division WWE3 bacterium RBG_19FT_COMBO_34_6]